MIWLIKKIDKNELCIYVITHKKIDIYPENNFYKILHVGAKGKEKFGYLTDDSKDNISEKNKNYCELTGLYWIWKNDKKSKYVGLTHYRRYFFKNLFSMSKRNVVDDDVLYYLKNGYVILPRKHIDNNTVREQYAIWHNVKDFDHVRDILKKMYPDYVESFDIVSNSKKFYTCNMFIMSKKELDKYCKWLFNILFALEKEVDISSYDDFNQRIYGFLSERLFNVYIIKNNLKIKEYPVFNIEKHHYKQLIKILLKME